jgi:hypothetical protein
LRDTSTRAQILIEPTEIMWLVSALASAGAANNPPPTKRNRRGGA